MTHILKSLRTTAGFLERCPIELGAGLTCIIGARGTCKSTVIEMIRFVFDCEPEKVMELMADPSLNGAGSPSHTGLIAAALGSGAATCTITRDEDGSSFTVERNRSGASRAYRDGIQQIDAMEVLHKIEIYSQGDLQSIAENPQRRLQLVDRPFQARRDEIFAIRARLLEKVYHIGNGLRSRRIEIERRRQLINGLGQRRRELSALEQQRPELSRELSAERELFFERKKDLERVREALEQRNKLLQSFGAIERQMSKYEAARTIASAASTALNGHIETSMAQLVDALKALASALEAATTEALESDYLALQTAFERSSVRYYELRKAQEHANESLKQEEALRREIDRMEGIEAELRDLEDLHERELLERDNSRREADLLGDELYSLRARHVQSINDEFGEHVVLTLHQGASSDAHVHKIVDLLRGSNLRNQEDVARDLAARLTPQELIGIVESSDAKMLADRLGRDISQANRLIAHLSANEDLYTLESMVSDDVLDITMFVRGESRPISQLSKGQMATALLPLILRDADYPLIFDQPEDDLDNAYISKTLIERILQLKKRRQLVFVTHNANIPVLGEADLVISMEVVGSTSARIHSQGDVDEMKTEIISLLEGGKEAFKQRQQRYGAALR